MKPSIEKSTSFLLFIILSILSPVFGIQTEPDPIVIGYSNHPEATAFNNARKIVRTSDDIRLVVYQDSVGWKPVVMWTTSPDGIAWSEPEPLGEGEFPALAIDSTDHVFAVWTRQDSSLLNFASFEKDASSPWKIKLTNRVSENLASYNLTASHISLESSSVGLHVVGEMNGSWFYSVYDKSSFRNLFYLSGVDVNQFYQLDRSHFLTRYPTITGDLGFIPGYLQVLWTDCLSNSEQTQIGYMTIDDKIPQFMSDYPNYLSIHFPPELVGKSFPSISARRWDKTDHGSYIMAYSGSGLKRFFSSTGAFPYDEYDYFVSDSFNVSDNPMPSVDDILPFMISCAIVWQNEGEIYYGQFEDQNMITQPPILVSEANGYPKNYPSVCYRTFRGDVFDVVWTEGSQAPYKVMYRRMLKCYMIDPVKIITKTLPDAVVGFIYFKPIQVTGGSGTYQFEIISGSLPSPFDFWNDNITASPNPNSSGVYHFTIKATDLAESFSDTASFTLVVKKDDTHLSSPDSVTAEKGVPFHYTASVLDPWNRKSDCFFQNLPSWLSASDSTVSGIVPLNAVDTCFQVIGTFRILETTLEHSDTLTITIHIQESNGVVNEDFAEIPKTFTLYPNYPNPFNPMTTIRFGLPESGLIVMDLVDLNGKLVKNILNQGLTKGFHSIVLDGSDLTSGVYVIRMRSGNFMKITKCVLLK
jgi:hypothetical protein